MHYLLGAMMLDGANYFLLSTDNLHNQESRKLDFERVGKKNIIMKKILFSVVLLVFTVQSFAQAPAVSKDYYLKKSKSQRNAAWILLAGGTLTTVIAALGYIKNDINQGSNSAENTLVVLMWSGIAADVLSIPFFISSAKNKKRAAAIAINSQPIYLQQQGNVAVKMQPTLSLKIAL
jgi:hypothetical protein